MKDNILFKLLLFILVFLVSFSMAGPIYAADEAGQLYAEGVAKANKGEFHEAIDLLQKALKLSAGNADAIHFELGRLYYITDDCRNARNQLSAFKASSEDEELKHYADSLAQTCGDVQAGQSYHIDVMGGLQYDTNAIVEPTNPAVKAGQKSDLATVIYLTGGAEVYDVDGISLTADYSLYQSLHAKLSDYNMQHHKFNPVLNFDLSDQYKPTVGYSYEFTRLENDNYSSIHNLYANLLIPRGDNKSIELMYEWRSKRYTDSELYPSNTDRDGYRHTFGARQNMYNEEYTWGIFVKAAIDKAKENYWSNHMFGGGADINYRIDEPMNLSAEAKYERRDYDNPFPTSSYSREDSMYECSVDLTYMLSDKLTLSLSHIFTLNDSNLKEFDYNRNITSVFISMGVL